MVKISVVMAAYNSAPTLPRAIDGLLAQTFDDFEIVIVDDGSTDATPTIVNGYAQREPRVRVISQANTGLTRALIRGCANARADVIARHDADDRSLPERLEKEYAALTASDDIVLASCGTRFIGPKDEELYIVRANGDEIRRSLLTDPPHKLHGITSHGSAMFRRDAYIRVGGYREQFRVAQDVDLWIRLAQLGRIAIVDDILYEASIGPANISTKNRPAQLASAGIAVRWRDDPRDEVLEGARNITRTKEVDEAAGYYFIASCLRRNNDPRWRAYAWEAVRRDPFHLRAWIRLLSPFK
jgi:glycosyltransferase involved in cell wall biosynthesis